MATKSKSSTTTTTTTAKTGDTNETPETTQAEAQPATSESENESVNDNAAATDTKADEEVPTEPVTPAKPAEVPEESVKPAKPAVGFVSVNNLLATQSKTAVAVTMSHTEMVALLKDKFGFDVSAPDANLILRGVVTDLNKYVIAMNPRAPASRDVVRAQQNNLVNRINDCLNSEPAIGVMGLQIIEQYFRSYSRGAFGGGYPFRGFDMLAPALKPFSEIIFTIQAIVKEGSTKAMKTIGLDKLKQAAPTPEGQIVLLAYINSHE